MLPGHDFHTASILGPAILLYQRKEDIKGTVRFIFQPAEEIAQGALYMTNAGVLDGVEAIFGMHNKPDLPVGTIGLVKNHLMASVDRFEIEITGVGGHAGIPNNTIDPIVVAGQMITLRKSPAGEDFAYYQTKIPGFFVWMGVDGPQEWHHPSFTLKEEALIVAANYFSSLAINVLHQIE